MPCISEDNSSGNHDDGILYLVGHDDDGHGSKPSVVWLTALVVEAAFGSRYVFARAHCCAGRVMGPKKCDGQSVAVRMFLQGYGTDVALEVLVHSMLEEEHTLRRFHVGVVVKDTVESPCLDFLSIFVRSSRVFVLIHKMDTIKDEREKENQFRIRYELISAANAERGIECSFFRTSIWDETLYRVRRLLLVPPCRLISACERVRNVPQ